MGIAFASLPSGAMMTPPMNYPDGVFVHLAQAVKAAVSVPVVAVGRLHDPVLAGRVIAEGKADLIALGRALVADPHWARKTREGRGEPIRACISCNTCVDGMREGSRIQCLVNPAAARETLFSLTPSPRPRRMLVACGGPAGMEAAAALARRGHTVALVERNGILGGQWIQAMKAPRFQNTWTTPAVMQRFLDYQAAELKRLGVEVRLGRSANRALVQEWRAEGVVSATGAGYRIPFNWIIPPLLESALMRTGWTGRLAGRPAFKWLLFRVLRRSAATLALELAGTEIETHAIGDCVTPGTTLEAMRSAAELAERL